MVEKPKLSPETIAWWNSLSEETKSSILSSPYLNYSKYAQDEEARTKAEEQRRWTADQELRERTYQQQRYSTMQQNYQINQTLEMRARPNQFVMPFQNGL